MNIHDVLVGGFKENLREEGEWMRVENSITLLRMEVKFND